MQNFQDIHKTNGSPLNSWSICFKKVNSFLLLVTLSTDAPFETFNQSIWKSLNFEGPNNVKDLCTKRSINNLPSIHPFQHVVLFHGSFPELISKWSTHNLLLI
jgi:hypothetical protein